MTHAGKSWKKFKEVGKSSKKLEKVGKSSKKLEKVRKTWKNRSNSFHIHCIDINCNKNNY